MDSFKHNLIEYKNKNPLTLKLLVSILLFSSVFAVFATAFQLYLDYKRDVGQIEKQIKLIGSLYIKPLAEHVWGVDKLQAEIVLTSILNLPDVQYVELVDSTTEITIHLGGKTDLNSLAHRFALEHVISKSETVHLGYVSINTTLDNVYSRLRERVLIILVTQAVKTFFVSLFIFLITYHLITRHLATISKYATAIDLKTLDHSLELRRKPSRASKPDELDQVVSSLNDMHARILSEISAGKITEEALRESEERFRSIFFATATPMAIVSPTGDVQQANPACCRFFGYSEEEFSRLRVRDVTHPDDRSKTRVLYEEALAGRRFDADYEKRYLHKDGTLLWGHTSMARVTGEQGQVKYFVTLTQDITARKQAEGALQESERRLATLMGNLPGMAYRCRNDRNWTMAFVSDGCRALTGYLPEDLIGNRNISFADIIHPEDREDVWQQIQIALESKGPFNLEYRICTAGGEERWAWEQGRGVFGEEGDLLTREGFIIDITERRKAVETLRKSDRMKTEFVKTVAHEFRTPLTAIQGFSEALLTHDQLSPEQQKECLGYIYERSMALADLVDDILDIARIESGKELSLNLSVYTVTEILRQVEPFLKTQVSQRQFDVSLVDENTLLNVDKGKIGQVLENLLSNAVKFSAGESSVRIRGELIEESYRISVADQGIGMTQEQVEKVFDKFYRADASDTAVEGVGLGMHIVKHIVETLGGRIWVESELGQGTTVNFTLPLAQKIGNEK